MLILFTPVFVPFDSLTRLAPPLCAPKIIFIKSDILWRQKVTIGTCQNGHLLSPENIAFYKDDFGRAKRRCKACQRIKWHKYRSKKNEHPSNTPRAVSPSSVLRSK